MKKPKGEYVIQTVINAMRLLEEFRAEEELGVTELSRRLDLHKNNVFRLLATLEQKGYIEQSAASERYRLGMQNAELGQAFLRSRPMLRRAHEVLVALARRAEETVHIANLSAFRVVHLGGESAGGMVRSALRTGQLLPCYCTALGKVLLACAPEEVRESYDRDEIGRGVLESRTPSTIVDRIKFFEELRAVSVQGFALDVEECEVGLCCAAAPVFDSMGYIVGALSVSGPSFRLNEDRLLEKIVPLVTSAAAELSRDIGYPD